MTTKTKALDEMTVPELKAELRALGMHVGGKKDELRLRLEGARDLAAAKAKTDAKLEALRSGAGESGSPSVGAADGSDSPVIEGEVVEEEDDTAEVPAEIADEVGQAIALREQGVTPTHAIPSVGEVAALSAIANSVYRTTFVPVAYRGREPDVLAAFMFGREIGLGPMMALRDIHMIDGRPALAAHRQLALLRRGGVSILESESTATRASIKAKRADTGEVMTVEFTMAEAELVVDRKGNHLVDKDNWKSYPADMLWARTVGRLTRRLGPDLAGGLPPYVAEEVADFSDWEVGYGETGPTFQAAPEPAPVVRKDLDWNAPKGWGELMERFGSLVGKLEAAEWMRQMFEAIYPDTQREELSSAQKDVAWQKAQGVLYAFDSDPEGGDPMFDPKLRERVQAAYGKYLLGVTLEGPEWRISPTETDRPTWEELHGDPAEPEDEEPKEVDEAAAQADELARLAYEQAAEADEIDFPDPSEGYPG